MFDNTAVRYYSVHSDFVFNIIINLSILTLGNRNATYSCVISYSSNVKPWFCKLKLN